MSRGPREVGLTLLAALAASQAALVVLNPLLPEVARDLDVSIATAGQLRTLSGLAAGLAALATGLVAGRVGLRGLLLGAVGLLAVGSAGSALSPSFAVLASAQALAGAGIGISYSAALAATAEWSTAETRSRILALTLLGPPIAWIVGMPLVGLLGEVDWRLAWALVPVSMAIASAMLLVRLPATPPAAARARLRAVVTSPGVARWLTGELLAFSGWAGALVYVGALLVESYGLSVAATGLALGLGALVYVPGNLLFRRWVDEHGRLMLVALALAAAATTLVDDLPAGGDQAAANALAERLTGLTLLGLVGIADPPRPQVKDAIALASQAGVSVKMITGDHATTARPSAHDLGIDGEHLVPRLAVHGCPDARD